MFEKTGRQDKPITALTAASGRPASGGQTAKLSLWVLVPGAPTYATAQKVIPC